MLLRRLAGQTQQKQLIVLLNQYNNGTNGRQCVLKFSRHSSVKSSTETVPVDSTSGTGQDVERRDEKPMTNKPFAKDLFLSKFDTNMLVYPEVSDKDDLDDLNHMVQPIEKFFSEGIDSKAMDVNAKIPEETLRHLGELGLFGQQIPHKYGGLELNATQYARLAEITALDGAIAVTLAAHQAIGLKGILIAGNEAQKQKYLPKLATGEHIAAFCLTEPSSGSDAASIQTRATLSEDGKTFHLNGGKIWISNGGIAHVFTVFARTEITNAKGEKEDKITAFIVEREFGGITSGQPEDKLGIRASNTCEVHFDNTPVPIENVIGEVGGGFKIAMNILNSGRFSMGSSGAGILKKLIGYTVEHAVTRTQFGKKLSEFTMIQEKFATMAVTTYAMESMAYMTAGVMDGYEKPDASVEAAMVKIFSSEGCWNCANECLQILGGLGYMKAFPYERYLRDARILLIFEGTNEILRMYVALAGAQHAGKELKELVKKLRNPLSNPGLVLQTAMERLRKNGEPKLTLKLNEHVHPSLALQAKTIESSTLKFGRAVQDVLQKHGNKVVNEQLDLKRLADICIDIYAMTACVARSSRAYCIGLKNADHEILLTQKFCHSADIRIKQNLKEINQGHIENGDEMTKEIADTVFKSHGYAAEHPLTVNW